MGDVGIGEGRAGFASCSSCLCARSGGRSCAKRRLFRPGRHLAGHASDHDGWRPRHAQEEKGGGMARNRRPISARAERRAGELLESCAQRATLAKHFQWKHGISLDASVLSLGRVPHQIGGSDERDLSRHIFECHGNLQSAGNASSPLYCRARQL